VVPETVGKDVLAGGDGGVTVPPTGAVSADPAVDPTPFLTEKTSLSVEPVSDDWTV
jgi:hypothetical protein